MSDRLHVWVSLPTLDRPLTNGQTRSELRSRFLGKLTGLLMAHVARFHVHVRRPGGWLAPRFGPLWTPELVEIACSLIRATNLEFIQELSVEAMRKAVAGELPTRGRFGRRRR